MTAILCTVRDGRAYLAADSRMTTGWVFTDTAEKIVRRRSWAFAVSGLAAASSWLVHRVTDPIEDESPDAYLFRIGCMLSEHMTLPAGQGTDDNSIATVFAISRGRAWKLEVKPVHVFPVVDCVGGGDATAAQAALLVARDHRGEGEAIRRALQACSAVCPGVGGPVRVWSCGPDDEQPTEEA